MIKLSLGCGFKHADCIGIDKADYGQKYVRDLRRGLPFSDNTIDLIYANSSLEHIPYAEHFGEEDFIFVMNECLRVLKPKGQMEIYVPSYDTHSAFKDPTHCRYFTQNSFSYLESSNDWKYGFNNGWKVLEVTQKGEIIKAILEKK